MTNYHLNAGKYGCEFLECFMMHSKAQDLEPQGIFFYHQGVFLSGVEELYNLTKNKAYDRYIHDYIDMFVFDKSYISKWRDVATLDMRQAANLAYRIYNETKDEHYYECIKYCADTLKEYPKNSLEGLFHMPETPYQMWLDSLYMAGPLCVKYASLSGDSYFYELTIKQALIMRDKLTDPVSGLMFHAWDESREAEWADKETGCSAIIWGRALGWVVVALPQIISMLPDYYKEKEELIEMQKNLIENLVRFQDKKTGMWFQVTDSPEREGNWPETSSTCLFVKGILSSIELGIIEETYAKNAIDAFNAVIEHFYKINDDMVSIEGICIGTGVDEGTYEHYINRPTTTNDLHGGGTFLMMCAEMEKYNIERGVLNNEN